MALKCLFDNSLVHGSKSTAEDDCVTVLMTAAAPMLYDPDQLVQNTAVEGFTKLLLHDRLNEATTFEVLLGLLTIFYHPLTAKTNARLGQCLSFFFHAYAFSTHVRQEQVRLLVSRCMENLVDTVPNIATVFTQMMYLCDPNNVNEPNSNEVDWSGLLSELLFSALRFHKQQDAAKMAKFLNCAAKLPLQATATNTQPIKECAYLCNLLLRHCPSTSHAALKKICTMLAVADHQQLAVLEKERLEALQMRISSVCPELLVLPVTGAVGLGGVGVGVGGKRQKKVVQVENVMDNLQDILE